MFLNILFKVTKKRLKEDNQRMPEVQLTVLMDENLRTELNIIAKRQKTTVKAIINNLVEDFVNENKSQ